MSTPMDIDADALPADIPEEQAVNQPEPADDHDETTSKKKAPKKPRGLNAEGGKGKSAERVPGTTTLPVARVKRILGADDDLQNISREALFLISIATEQFLKRMTDSAYLKARMDGRKTITMKDLSSAVKQNPEMEFLSDIVPAAVPLSVALASRKKNAQDPKAFSNLENQPLSSLLPQVPMLPSRNPDYPDALVRRPKDMSKARSARKSAAGTATGEADPGEADPEAGVGAVPKRAGKGKPKARKSGVAGEGDVDGGLEKTLAQQSESAVLLGHPKAVKKTAVTPVDPPTPSVGQSAEAMDDDW